MWCLNRINFERTIHINANEFTIGRNQAANLVCISAFVSRNHAVLKILPNGKLAIKDLCSTNGIFINNTRIPSNVCLPVHLNDRIGLGTCEQVKKENYYIYKVGICRSCSSPDHKEIINTELPLLSRLADNDSPSESISSSFECSVQSEKNDLKSSCSSSLNNENKICEIRVKKGETQDQELISNDAYVPSSQEKIQTTLSKQPDMNNFQSRPTVLVCQKIEKTTDICKKNSTSSILSIKDPTSINSINVNQSRKRKSSDLVDSITSKVVCLENKTENVEQHTISGILNENSSNKCVPEINAKLHGNVIDHNRKLGTDDDPLESKFVFKETSKDNENQNINAKKKPTQLHRSSLKEIDENKLILDSIQNDDKNISEENEIEVIDLTDDDKMNFITTDVVKEKIILCSPKVNSKECLEELKDIFCHQKESAKDKQIILKEDFNKPFKEKKEVRNNISCSLISLSSNDSSSENSDIFEVVDKKEVSDSKNEVKTEFRKMFSTSIKDDIVDVNSAEINVQSNFTTSVISNEGKIVPNVINFDEEKKNIKVKIEKMECLDKNQSNISDEKNTIDKVIVKSCSPQSKIKLEIKEENGDRIINNDSDIFICSQLFDDDFNTDSKCQNEEYDKMLLSFKKETDYEELNAPDIVVISDDDSNSENPWLERLSQSKSFKSWSDESLKSENISNEIGFGNNYYNFSENSLNSTSAESYFVNEVTSTILESTSNIERHTKVYESNENLTHVSIPRVVLQDNKVSNKKFSNQTDNELKISLEHNLTVKDCKKVEKTKNTLENEASSVAFKLNLESNKCSEKPTDISQNQYVQLDPTFNNSLRININRVSDSTIVAKTKNSYVKPPIIDPPIILNKYHRRRKEEQESKAAEKNKKQELKKEQQRQIQNKKQKKSKKEDIDKEKLQNISEIISYSKKKTKNVTKAKQQKSNTTPKKQVDVKKFYNRSPKKVISPIKKTQIKTNITSGYQKNRRRTPVKLKGGKFHKLAEVKKQRLKEIALEQKNDTTEIYKNKSAKISVHPKIKVTHSNRSDALVADLIGISSEASTSKPSIQFIDIFKDTVSTVNYKIPKKKNAAHTKSNEKSNKNEENNRKSSKNDKNERLSKENKICDSSKEKCLIEETSASLSLINLNVDNINKNVKSFFSTVLKSILIDPSKKRKSSKLKVRYDLQPKVREFEIEEGNFLNPCKFKDAPMPRKKNVNSTTLTVQNIPINTFNDKNLVKNDYLTIDDVIYQITKWNPECLLDENMSVIIDKPLTNVLTRYSSYREYCDKYTTFLYYEVWNYILKEWNFRNEDIRKRKMMVTLLKTTDYPSNSLNPENKLMLIDCQVLLNSEEHLNKIYPTVGDLVIIYLLLINPKTESEEYTSVFAYVKSSTKQLIKNSEPILSNIANTASQPTHVVHLTVITLWRHHNVVLSQTAPLRIVIRLTSSLRQFKSIIHLPRSPLLDFILNPLSVDFKLPNYEVGTLFTNHVLNKNQLNTVFEACETCLQPKPKIYLLEGASGTGKSLVIINLVLQLLYGDNRYMQAVKKKTLLPRILLCAPSSASIDTLTVELLKIRKDISHNRFKMVRHGPINNMNENVKCISVEELANTHIKHELKSVYENGSLAEDRNNLLAKINSLENQLMNSPPNAVILQKRLYEYKRCLEALPKDGHILTEVEMNRRLWEAQQLVLRNADIVCTTLSGCSTDLMDSLTTISDHRFTCCIIDEASQCNEPDTLLPLMLGISTLILVSDPCQFPMTVLSSEAQLFGYKQSLFARLKKLFVNSNNSPVRFLNVQYRMHPEIFYWPHKYFYNNYIESLQPIAMKTNPLRPYRVVSHNYLQTSNKECIEEAVLTAHLAVQADLLTRDLNLTISIITPFWKQKACIEQCLKNLSSTIEVNLIDAFQGQERDVILLSCVPTNESDLFMDAQRINIAVTRAKCSFFVITNFQTLQNNMWRSLQEDAEKRHCLYNLPSYTSINHYKEILLK